jgi:hypothetical protein
MKKIMILLVVWGVLVGPVWAEMERVSATERITQSTKESGIYGKL